MATGGRIFVLSDGDDGTIESQNTCIERELSVIEALLTYPRTHIEHIHFFLPAEIKSLLSVSLTSNERLSTYGVLSSQPQKKRNFKERASQFFSNLPSEVNKNNAVHKKTTTLTLNLLDYIADLDIPPPTAIITNITMFLAALTLSDIYLAIPIFILSSDEHARPSHFPHTCHSTSTALRAAQLIHQTVRHSSNSNVRLSVSPDDDHWHSLTHVCVYRERYFRSLVQLNKWRRNKQLLDLTELKIIDCLFGAPPVTSIINVPKYFIPLAVPIHCSSRSFTAVQPLRRHLEDNVPKDTRSFLSSLKISSKGVVICITNESVSAFMMKASFISGIHEAGATHIVIINSILSSKLQSSKNRMKRQLRKYVKGNVHAVTISPLQLQATLSSVLPHASCLVCDTNLYTCLPALYTGTPVVAFPSSTTQKFWASLLTSRGVAINGSGNEIKKCIEQAVSPQVKEKAAAAAREMNRPNASHEGDDGFENESSLEHSAYSSKAVARLVVDVNVHTS